MKPVGRADRVYGALEEQDLRLKEWRLELNLSQRQLARLAGIPVSTLNEIENGYRSGATVRDRVLAALQVVADRVAPVAVAILKSRRTG